jgi:hypothetical protein
MTPFLVSAIVSFTLFLFVVGMRPNTMKAHGKEGMFRQLPLMVDAFLERRLHIPERRPMADFGVRSGGRVFDFDFPDVAEHLFRGNGLALDARFLSFAYSFELGSLVFGCFFGIFFGY